MYLGRVIERRSCLSNVNPAFIDQTPSKAATVAEAEI